MAANPEKVESLDAYRSEAKTYDVSIAFTGEAAATMRRLMNVLGTSNPNDVAKRAIALLDEATQKDLILRDRQSGVEYPVDV